MKTLFALGLIGAVLLGCSGRPFLLHGDADSADVGYGSDPAETLPIAKAHCARYERVPRLLQTQENVAYYECARP